MAQGADKSFPDVIRANIGDCHAVGQRPLTFIRQVREREPEIGRETEMGGGGMHAWFEYLYTADMSV